MSFKSIKYTKSIVHEFKLHFTVFCMIETTFHKIYIIKTTFYSVPILPKIKNMAVLHFAVNLILWCKEVT